jgi:hypothetical protein
VPTPEAEVSSSLAEQNDADDATQVLRVVRLAVPIVD